MMLAKEKSHLKQNTRKQLLLEILHVKVVQHLQFHFVRIGSAQNQTMQRLAEIHFTKLLQRSEADELIRLPDTRQTHRQCVRSTHYPSIPRWIPTSLLMLLLHLQQLIDGLVARHKARRKVHGSSLHELLEIGLLHLDIYRVSGKVQSDQEDTACGDQYCDSGQYARRSYLVSTSR